MFPYKGCWTSSPEAMVLPGPIVPHFGDLCHQFCRPCKEGGRAGGASERLAPEWALGSHTVSSFKQHMFSPSGEVRILLTTWSLEKPPPSSEA